jgi:hypothetical protein
MGYLKSLTTPETSALLKSTCMALLTSVTLAKCGPPPDTRVLGGAVIDPAANAEVWSFEQALGLQVTVPVGFWGDVSQLDGADADAVGLCLADGAVRQVWLDSQYWAASPECREALVFHELGHCVLGLDHDDRTTDNGRPLSVMHPYVSRVCWAWPHYRDDYVKGLQDGA